MGLSAYATVQMAIAFAYRGVRGSFAAKYTARVSFFSARAWERSFLSMKEDVIVLGIVLLYTEQDNISLIRYKMNQR